MQSKSCVCRTACSEHHSESHDEHSSGSAQASVWAGYLTGLALRSDSCYKGGQLSLLLLDGCMSSSCTPAHHAACLHTSLISHEGLAERQHSAFWYLVRDSRPRWCTMSAETANWTQLHSEKLGHGSKPVGRCARGQIKGHIRL